MKIPFADNISPDIKLSKAQLSKTIQSVGFLGVFITQTCCLTDENCCSFG